MRKVVSSNLTGKLSAVHAAVHWYLTIDGGDFRRRRERLGRRILYAVITLRPAHSFVKSSLYLCFKKSKLSVTGERMSTQYWQTGFERLVNEQCG